MFWKMTNLQLKKGYVFSPYGDSAPFLGRFAEEQIYLINGYSIDFTHDSTNLIK